MGRISWEERRRLERMAPRERAALQLAKLNALLQAILPANRFYAEKFARLRLPLRSLEELSELPLTTKEELANEGMLPANLTWDVGAYSRYHETSGTRGRPLPVYDTRDDWRWWRRCWQFVLDAAEISRHDRAVLAFSFGPFIGFWSARDALAARGALVIPGGGMSSRARIELIQRTGATTLFCTPTYALRLVETASDMGVDLAEGTVRSLVVAGEPGGSIASVRHRLESAWGARVVDHAGASEIGPWGYGDSHGQGLYVLESEFIAEFLTPGHDTQASAGEMAELALTSLGRHGMPVIRYRTGDLVRREGEPSEEPTKNRFVLLRGGVLGRADDMVVIRGVNVFPSSIDDIVRGFPEVEEYRAVVGKRGDLAELLIEVEDRLGQPERIAEAFAVRMGLRVQVQCVAPKSLPRFEGKARRMEREA